MKNIVITLLIVSVFLLKKLVRVIWFVGAMMYVACDKIDNDPNDKMDNRENYLVDKVSYFWSYSNNKSAQFFYDSDNKIVKRRITGYVYENSQVREVKYVHLFEYENELVSKIRVYDSIHFQFNYDINLFYDSLRNLIREESWQNGSMIGHNNFHYENNRMVSVYDDTTEPFETNTIVYDTSGNAIKHMYTVPKQNALGMPIPDEYVEIEHVYEYDNGLKPNFGIDYLFVYQPLMGLNGEDGFARELSFNNLTKYLNNGTTWIFTYDEKGLVTEYEVKWGGIEMLTPMIYEITYKQIE